MMNAEIGQKFEPAVGALLRASRLRCGEELREVAAVLRIRHAYLEAIEEGRYENLPGVTYAVGFVRTYAEHLGLDAEEVVRRFKTESENLERRTELVFPSPIAERGTPGAAIIFIGVLVAALAYGAWYVGTSEDSVFDGLVTPLPDRLVALLPGDHGQPAETPTEPDPAMAAPQAELGSPGSPPPEPVAGNGAPLAETSVPEAVQPEQPASVEPVIPAPGGAEVSQAAAPEETTVAEPAPSAPAGSLGQTDVAPSAAPAPDAAPQSETAPAPVAVPETPNLAAAPAAPVVAPKPVPAPVVTAAAAPLPSPAPVAPVAERPQAPAAAPEPVVAQAEAPAPEAPETTTVQETPPEVAAVAQPVPETPQANEPPVLPQAPAVSSVPAQPVAEVPQNPAAAPASPAEPEVQQEAAVPEAPVVETATASLSSPAAASGARIEVRALSDSWIQIRDGIARRLLVTRLLRAGDTYLVPDQSGLTLLTGNAGALEILVDGAVVAPIGEEGAVRRNVALDAERLLSGTAVVD